MDVTRFHSMRTWIAVLASLWFVVQCASVVESHESEATWTTHSHSNDDPKDAPWSDDADNERSDADESEDEEREDDAKVLSRDLIAAELRLAERSTLYDLSVVPERAGHELPPTPPPQRGC